MHRLWFAGLLAGVTIGWNACADEVPPLFPFVLPWDDATPGITDLSGGTVAPAGKDGPIRVGKDAHFYAGDKRIRFFGVNVCFGADFPTHDAADKIAARMAKFGINVVRFHHPDMFAFPRGIRARAAKDTGALDPEALDRLDYFIAQLKRHGIYANLNLLVGRPFNAADGLPVEIEQLEWKDRHVIGFFDAKQLALQQEYARKLLTHHNPYTGATYAAEPAVAFIEINNENGLIHAWQDGVVDKLPAVFRRDLQRQWNAWLQHRYPSTAQLRVAWKAKAEPVGDELLHPEFERWVLERHEGAEATAVAHAPHPNPLPRRGEGTGKHPASPPGGEAGAPPVVGGATGEGVRVSPAVRLTVTKPSPTGWHVQFNQPGVPLVNRRAYTLRFRARAESPATISINISQAHNPWGLLGLSAPVALTTDWQSFQFVFESAAADRNARVNFSDLAQQTNTYWITDVSLKPGGVVGLTAGERLEDQSLPLFAKTNLGARTGAAQRDWLRFLWETEDHYWERMDRYLKDELRVRAVVMGTIVGCSTPELMARFGAIDTHAYWQHPHFPGRPWDPDNWTVNNVSMVNDRGGTLPGLALRRVLGKPLSVTEYNHPAPNTFSSEAFPLLAAYAALQDWDAIYAFAYSHRQDDWDARRMTSFFDIDQHPTKLASLLPAVAMFVRGDVQPARQLVSAPLDRAQEIELLRGSQAWRLVDAGLLGIAPETALEHRVGINLEGNAGTSSGTWRAELRPPAEATTVDRFISDTGELVWDVSTQGQGVVTVNAARSKAVIGYGGGKRFDLGGWVIEPGATRQAGWSVITVTRTMPGQFLITATGDTENTAMHWKSAARDSVGRDWGRAPSLAEGVPARIQLPARAKQAQAWALDERGQRREPVPVVTDAAGRNVVVIDSRYRTLWYEVFMKETE